MRPTYTAFVGIDVSKDTLDLCLLKDGSPAHFKIENSVIALKAFFTETPALKELKRARTLYCFEQMGFYNNHLYAFLEAKKACFSVQNPLHLKKSMGLVRGKSDKIDAQRIALFASKNADTLQLWARPREIITQLKSYAALRKRFLTMRTQIKVPLNGSATFQSKALNSLMTDACARALAGVTDDLKAVDEAMLELVKSDRVLNRLFEVITSVKNIGPVIAIKLITVTNEFKDFETPGQLASYAGIAPFTYQSGTSLNSKGYISFYGNKELKTLLHLAAVGSLRFDGALKDYYARKTGEGKHPHCVLNAIRNKLLKQIFSCVKEDRLYEKNYTKSRRMHEGVNENLSMP